MAGCFPEKPRWCLSEQNPAIRTVCVDLADWATTRKAVEDIGPVDLLVNNAGLGGGVAFLDTTEAEIDSKFAVNVKAVINVSQVVAKGMVARGQGGAVVNISSMATRIGLQDHLAYCASKGAVDQITRVMALELGPHQIRVNSVNPTIVMTEMGRKAWGDPVKNAPMRSRTPLGKFAEVEDVVHAVLYVLSDKADMVNGITLFVDGERNGSGVELWTLDYENPG
ncbi:hypothetical protein NP493_296g00031 [Ridgeia piscesae]|uniref:L-xylulose reductase n=1 Tax=Ridgeia piscesae TaxID=27915 RepID=A0AAD9NWI1_RIDPI|nr:hypothetical protein NP493_296g00031 [Ridgeia piscesae]